MIVPSRCPMPEDCEEERECQGHCAEKPMIHAEPAALEARYELEIGVHDLVTDRRSRKRFPITNMFDLYNDMTDTPARAHTVVAYLGPGQWLATVVDPENIYARDAAHCA